MVHWLELAIKDALMGTLFLSPFSMFSKITQNDETDILGALPSVPQTLKDAWLAAH